MTPCVKPQKPERPESISYLTIMSGLTAILSAPNPKIRSALQLFCLIVSIESYFDLTLLTVNLTCLFVG